MEIWKAIPGFEDTYSVSNLGRVKTTKQRSGTNAGKILKPGLTLGGYHQYTLGRYGGRHTAHLLVMLAFVGPRPVDFDINHKNGIKTDNRLENLEYLTKSENCLHMTKVLEKRRGESHGNAKITEDDVREIRRLAASGLSQYAIATRFNLTRPNIGYIVRRKAWSHVD